MKKVKFDLNDDRVIGIALVILAVLPSFIPMVIPTPPNKWTVQFNTWINSLSPNSVLLIDWEPWLRGMPYQWEGPLTAAIKILWDKQVKFVAFGHDITTVEYFQQFFQEATGQALYPNPLYGSRYIWFGFIGTGGPAMRLFLSNFRAVRTVDNYGNKLDDLNVTKNMNTITNFSAYLELGVAYLNTVFVPQSYKNTQGTGPFPSYAVTVTGTMNNLFPMWVLGWWNGLVFDNVGGSELEQMHGIFGSTPSQKIVNGEVLALGTMMLLMLLFNIYYWRKEQ